MGVNFSNIACGSASRRRCDRGKDEKSPIILAQPEQMNRRRLGETLLQHLGEHAAIKLIELSMSLARQLLAFTCLEAPL
jgi:hypothetical protein